MENEVELTKEDLDFLSKLEEAASKKPVLIKGRRSGKVIDLQKHLNKNRPNGHRYLSVDGYFGPITEARVKKYQKSKGITVDGIVGLSTWSQLLAETYQ